MQLLGEMYTYDEAIMDHEAPVEVLRLIETPVVLIQELPEGKQLEQGPEHEQPIEREQHVQQEPVQVQPIQAPPAQDIMNPVMVDAMNVATLKSELAKRSLPVGCNKSALKERLLGAIASQQIPQDQPIGQVQPVLQV